MKKSRKEPPTKKIIIIIIYAYSISSVKTSEIRIMEYTLKGRLIHLKEEETENMSKERETMKVPGRFERE